jgi:hypothetical protein
VLYNIEHHGNVLGVYYYRLLGDYERYAATSVNVADVTISTTVPTAGPVPDGYFYRDATAPSRLGGYAAKKVTVTMTATGAPLIYIPEWFCRILYVSRAGDDINASGNGYTIFYESDGYHAYIPTSAVSSGTWKVRFINLQDPSVTNSNFYI